MKKHNVKTGTKDSNKVTLVTTWLSYGGAEIQVFTLAKGLSERGWDVEVVSMRNPSRFTKELESLGIKMFSLNMNPGQLNLSGIIKLVRYLRNRKTTILHSHMIHANILCRIIRKFLPDHTLICTAHNIYEGGRLSDIAYRYTDGIAEMTTNVSTLATKRYIADRLTSSKKIRTVYNGIDTNKFNPDVLMREKIRTSLELSDKIVFLCVGRFTQAKNHETLIRAFKKLTLERSDTHLILVGEGPLKNNIEAKINEEGIADKVTLLEARNDIPDIMSASDIYVMSSSWEGLPLVLLEAGASQLPIVATDVGGNREAINQAFNELVPSNDYISLYLAMQKMSSINKSGRDRIGKENRKYVRENFDIELILDQWETLYNEMRA